MGTKQTRTDDLNVRRNHRVRLRIIEELYIDGYGALEIHDKLVEGYPDTHGKVQPGTVRKDIVAIRKAWSADLDAADQITGRLRYLSSTRLVRRKALDDGSAQALKLVHSVDQELARLCGVVLKVDNRTLHIDVKKAESFMDEVMGIVFDRVTDTTTRELIVADLEGLAVADNE